MRYRFVDGGPPRLARAGRQFVARHGVVDESVLRFLPTFVGDLHAREVLIEGATQMVEGFLSAMAGGRARAYARDLVPRRVAAAVTDDVAHRLFCAASALVARLSGEQAAGSLAEEVLAARLVERAAAALDDQAHAEAWAASDFDGARDALGGVFDLSGDRWVLLMFEPGELPLSDRLRPTASGPSRPWGTFDGWFDTTPGTIKCGYLSTP